MIRPLPGLWPALVLVMFGLPACLPALEARDDVASVDEDHSVVIDVGANDSDVERILLTGGGNTGHGSVVVLDRSHIRYIPNADFAGTDRFGYQAVQGGDADNAEVVVTVRPDLDLARQEFPIKLQQQETIAAGDFDADGLLDLAILHANEALTIALQRARPGEPVDFEQSEYPALDASYSRGPFPKQLLSRDLNGDGADDLVFASSTVVAVVFMLADGRGGFESARIDLGPLSSPDNVAIGDFDADDRLDLVVTTQGTGPSAFTHFIRGLAFSASDVSFAADERLDAQLSAVHVADLDGDGRDELLASDWGSLTHWQLDAEGRLKPDESTERMHVERFAEADFDGDDQLDLIFATHDQVTVLPSGEPRTPVRIDDRWLGLAVADLDGDGAPELIGDDGQVQRVWQVSGSDPLAFVSNRDLAEQDADFNGLLAADLDADGHSDLIMLGTHYDHDNVMAAHSYFAVYWGR